MKYLRIFETQKDYNNYITSNYFISPNLSRIENNNNILMRFDNNAAMLTATFNIPYDNYTCNIVSNYNNTIKKVIIDDEIIYDDFTNFTGIKQHTFKTAGIHTIKISFNNKYVIGNNAPIFNGVSNLKDIKIPNIFTEISSNAFINCLLTEINIPNSITNIGQTAFGGCPLKKITFGKGLTSLNSLSYYSINGYFLEECNILSEITTLPSNMFSGCSHLLKVTIPDSVTSIGDSTFNNCSNLEEVNISNNSSLTNIGNNAFYSCTSLTSINIPDSVTSIGNSTFSGCTNLTSINIPDSVTSIGNSAFYYCNKLTSITIPESVISIGPYAFSGCTNLTSINIPNSVTSIENSVFNNCSELTSITIPESVTSIGPYAFYNTKLSNINISNNLTSIGSYAFNLNSNARSNVYFDNSTINNLGNIINPSIIKNLEIGQHTITQNGELCLTTFGGFSNMESITLPEGLTVLPNLSGSSSLKTFNVPTTITTIADNCFWGCNSLEDSYVEDGIRYIDIDGFGTYIISITDYTLQSYTIKNGVKGLPFTFNSSFTNIQGITLPNSLTNIVDGAFNYLYDNDILTSQQIDFILSINPNAISKISKMMNQSKSYFEDKYFTICALENGTLYYDFTDSSDSRESENYKALEYSKDDGETWLSINNIQTSTKNISISKNDIILLRSNITPIYNTSSNKATQGIGNIYASFKYHVCGNIMSLLYGDDFNNKTSLIEKNYAFHSLFSLSNHNSSLYRKLIRADKLILPAITLSERCYYDMFYGCTSLTTAPELPATTLASYCYNEMFRGCTSLTTAPELPATTLAPRCYERMFILCTALTTAPELPATTLADYCYHGMFSSCTALTTAPELPATTLAKNCYNYMFYGCRALTIAPELPATTLAKSCYYQMFFECTALTTAPELPATTLAEDCYHCMFQGCTSLTTAPELPATTLAPRCYERMFTLCTALTTAPELPATTLADYCYHVMFSSCRALTIAPELPATTLANDCYNYMFYGCRALTIAPELPATTLAKSCYYQMFFECTSLTTAPELPATTLAKNCYNGMFFECTSLTTAPELPATTLADSCYNSMFSDCTSLTTAPELPATTLANYCYSDMFNGCTSLTTAPELPATTLASYCYNEMFRGCTSLTTAPELPATTLANSCYQYMFSDCTSLTTAPELPATTLTNSCYLYMFLRCKSLTTAPELHATTLAQCCYYWMFCGCTSLSKIIMLATNISASLCLDYWTFGVAAIGTFIKAASMTSLSTGNNGIPEGWTVQDYEEPHVPRELPEGYTEVKYIASTNTGGQYIDLNILLYDVLNKNYDIAIKYNVLGAGKDNNQPTLFGCQNQNSPWPGTFIRMNQNSSTNTIGRYIGGTNKDNTLGNNNTIIELPVQTSPNKNVYNYNNSGKTHSFGTSLFCAFSDANNTPFKFIEAQIYYFKLFVEGTLVRDLVPCINSSNVPGLYDVVNDVFYTSLSSSSFIYESYQS